MLEKKSPFSGGSTFQKFRNLRVRVCRAHRCWLVKHGRHGNYNLCTASFIKTRKYSSVNIRTRVGRFSLSLLVFSSVWRRLCSLPSFSLLHLFPQILPSFLPSCVRQSQQHIRGVLVHCIKGSPVPSVQLCFLWLPLLDSVSQKHAPFLFWSLSAVLIVTYCCHTDVIPSNTAILNSVTNL